MDKNDLIELSIETKDAGCSIWLDDKELHHVKNYKIENGSIPGTAIVEIKLLVKYP